MAEMGDSASEPAPTTSGVPSQKVLGKKVSPRKLTLKQQAFVEHYADPTKKTFGNGRQAYLRSHPTSGVNNAGVAACRTLKDSKVHEAVEVKLKAAGVNLHDEAAWGIAMAKLKSNLPAHNAYIQTLATLKGEWKQRSEVETISNDTKDLIRRTVAERLNP